MLREKIGDAAMLEQLAEECTELAQASLKFARALRNENPGHKNPDEIIDNWHEELADVMLCIGELNTGKTETEVENWIEYKQKRIRERFKNADN